MNNQSRSRLDRFLVTDNWDSMLNGAMQGIFPRPASDHFPILLEGGGMKRGPSPFKFENMWLDEKGLKGPNEEVVGELKFYWDLQLYLGRKTESLKRYSEELK